MQRISSLTAERALNMPLWESTIEIPEPFRSALAENRPAGVGDSPTPDASAQFGRGLARLAVGRDSEAEADFQAARPVLGDPCRLELAYLQLRSVGKHQEAAHAAREIASRAEENSPLAARAWHVLGLAEEKLRHVSAAVDALLRAAEIYRRLGQPLGRARVYDSLGMVQEALGRLDHALYSFSMSLVDKSLGGDLSGMAITLGNLGRVHLRTGRFQDAIDCFTRDLEIAVRLNDLRGQARMREDLGRAYLGLEDYARSVEELLACLKIAERQEFRDLAFFAHKDLVYARLGQRRWNDAQNELAAAERELPSETNSYYPLLMTAARGALWAAQRNRKAIEMLESAVRGFQEAELPDLEIAARLALAQTLLDHKYKASAEHCLLRGLKIARSEGYARYLRGLNEAMTRLDLVEGIIEEADRPIDDAGAASRGGYVIRQQVGSGAFGDVFRVYDAQRGEELALKRLRLDDLYDPAQRRQVLDSAHRELEAASRVRHPGVVRVLALGREPGGSVYVVQEFIRGPALDRLLPTDTSADERTVLACIERIAEALTALHEADVVHRDLKPANILMRDSQSPVLVDFGIAHFTRQKHEDDRLLGTLAYMAPEQALGKRVDRRADLYSLGVIAYEWLAGIRPLNPRGADLTEMARDVATRVPPRLSDFRPQVSPEVEQLVMALLAKKAWRRPVTAAVVAQCCRDLASQLAAK